VFTILLVTATTVIVETIHIVVAIAIVNTNILVCWDFINNTYQRSKVILPVSNAAYFSVAWLAT